MNRFSNQRDLTARRNPSGGGTGSTAISFVKCGCTRQRQVGAVFKGSVAWKCHVCAPKGKA